MRLARKKIIDKLGVGNSVRLRKLSDGEFLIFAKREISKLFAEGVTEKSPEKFGDIMEIINNVCDVINIDFYECMKARSDKRFSEGVYIPVVFSEEFSSDLREGPEN